MEQQEDSTEWMHVLLTDLRTENEQLRAIVKEVATGDTTYTDDWNSANCVFCIGKEGFTGKGFPHADDCIVTLARAIMQKSSEDTPVAEREWSDKEKEAW